MSKLIVSADGLNISDVMNLSAWNCDSIGDRVIVRNAFGAVVFSSETFPIETQNGLRTTPLEVVSDIRSKGIETLNKFGTDANYSEFENDGTLVFNGSATVFDDESGSGINLQRTGVGISNNLQEATVEYLGSANLDDYISTSMQMKHKWKLGTKIKPHIHWQQNQAIVPNWLIQYRWQSNGEIKNTSWTSVKCTNNTFTYTSGILNQISEIIDGITPPENASLSDIIQFRVLRDSGNDSGLFTGVDIYSGVASLMSFDFHMEIDTVGSRQEYIK